MEELIVLAIQFFFEVVLDVLGNGLFDWPFQGRSRRSHDDGISLACVIWFFLACFIAWVSLFLLPHTLISLPAFRIANLAVGPVASAFASQAIARHRARTNDRIDPRYHFWKSFWFTLGLVLVRFAYASRM